MSDTNNTNNNPISEGLEALAQLRSALKEIPALEKQLKRLEVELEQVRWDLAQKTAAALEAQQVIAGLDLGLEPATSQREVRFAG
ncbi:MAG: hypothetical protein AAFS10_13255 [Myxococcota bacterium]